MTAIQGTRGGDKPVTRGELGLLFASLLDSPTDDTTGRRLLASMINNFVTGGIAANEDLVHSLVVSADEESLRRVASSRRLPSGSYETISEEAKRRGFDSVLFSLAANPAAGEVHRRLCESSPKLTSTVAMFSADQVLLEEIARHGDGRDRLCVADNYGSSERTLSQLANDEDAEVRRTVAANPTTAHEVVLSLAIDSDRGVAEKARMRLDADF